MSSDWYERDYERTVDARSPTTFLPGTSIEIIRAPANRGSIRHVLFDFDGTVSLIREGWPEVMVPMMVEVLLETDSGEAPEVLRQLCYDFVMQLNGKQTIYQMIRLAEEVKQRGREPEEPRAYKQRYHDRLMDRINDRRERLRSKRTAPEEMLVPHSLQLLEQLRDRGMKLYLASGTDDAYVREEAELLGLTEFFGPHVYGAPDNYQSYSKAKVIERILSEHRVDGTSLLGFGDGYVEIQNVKAVNGTAVAVASDESGKSGKSDPWKRDRLIGVGADLVVPDYSDSEKLLAFLDL
jgi:phosphoglycolate phosphatase-like HAD superfamily hydrolase